MNKKAIFTILQGEKYVNQWKQYSETSWRAYAAKHGYDIVVVTEPIRQLHDPAVRPIHWQKLFIPAHPRAADYDDVVFMDSDIIINWHRAPCVVEANGSDKIGMVRFDRYVDDNMNYYLIFIRQAKFKNYRDRVDRLRQTPGCMSLTGPDYSREYGAYTERKDLPILNTGVMVMKPSLHGALLERIYSESFADVADGAVPGSYEQEYLAYRLLQADMVNLIDERFNTQAYFEMALHYPFLFAVPDKTLMQMCMTTVLSNCYFLHFAGNSDLMPFAVASDEADFAILGLKDAFKNDIEIIRNRRPVENRGSLAP